MANIKVSELNETTSLNNSDYFMVVQNNESKKTNLSNVLNKTFYKEIKSFNEYSDLIVLINDINSNKDKICFGNIGTLDNTNLKTLLGSPNIGNYTICVFETIDDFGQEGCIKVIAYAPYTTNTVEGYIIYDTVNNIKSARFTGWGKYEYNVAMPNGSQNIYFKRYGHIVEVWYNGDISSFPVGQEVILISNISEEFRPDHLITFSSENSVPAQVRFNISPAGVLSAYNYSTAITSANNFQFHTIYLVD